MAPRSTGWHRGRESSASMALATSGGSRPVALSQARVWGIMRSRWSQRGPWSGVQLSISGQVSERAPPWPSRRSAWMRASGSGMGVV